MLFPMLEERRLTLHDGSRNLDEGFVANLQALEQPARFLKLCAHAGVTGIAADEAGVAVIQPDARQGGRVDLNSPALLRATNKHIRYHVFRGARDRKSV